LTLIFDGMSVVIERTRESFLKRFDNKKTQSVIQNSFDAWDKFLQHRKINEKAVLELMQSNNNDKYLLLSELIQHWKASKSPKTICDVYWPFIKQWIKYSGGKLDDDQLKEYIKFPKQLRQRPVPMDRDKIRLMYEKSNDVYKALWLVLASSGARIGEVLQILVSDVDFNSNPVKITIRAEIAGKNGIERITFVTPEATRLLKEICKSKEPHERVFPMVYSTVASYIMRLRKKTGLTQKTLNGKFYHVRIHKFRKFTETNISNSRIPETESDEFAHAILGHEKYLMVYYETPEKEMAEMYSNAIPRLTISDEQRYKEKSDKLESQLLNQNDSKQEILELKARVKMLEDLNKA